VKSKNAAEIQALIQDFATKLDVLIRADIIHALTELVGNGGVVSENPGKSPKAAAGGKGAKRTPAELDALTARLLAYISKHPGERIEKIAIGMSTTTKELNLPVKKLVADKSISTKGQKRATSYYAKKG